MKMSIGDLVLVEPYNQFQGGEFKIDYMSKDSNNITLITENRSSFVGYRGGLVKWIHTSKKYIIRNISVDIEKNIKFIKDL